MTLSVVEAGNLCQLENGAINATSHSFAVLPRAIFKIRPAGLVAHQRDGRAKRCRRARVCGPRRAILRRVHQHEREQHPERQQEYSSKSWVLPIFNLVLVKRF